MIERAGWFEFTRAFLGRSNRGEALLQLADAHPEAGILKFPIPGQFVGLVLGESEIEDVLLKQAASFAKSPDYHILAELIGYGLVTQSGETWKRERDLLKPVFTIENLKLFYPEILASAQRAKAKIESSPLNVDLSSITGRYALEIVGQLCLSLDFTADVPLITQILENTQGQVVKRGFSPIDWQKYVPTPAQRRFKREVGRLRKLILDKINQRSKIGSHPKRMDLYSALRAGHLSDSQICDHILTFLMAGHETSATALWWFYYALATHPSYQAQIAAEWAAAQPDALRQWPNPKNFSQTMAVLNETMRLYPPIGFFGRQSTSPVTLTSGEKLAPGSILIVSPYVLHRAAKNWKEPRQFLPERFKSENSRGMAFDPRYLPFGFGPRSCIGYMLAYVEMTVFIGQFANWSVKLNNPKKVEAIPLVSLKPSVKQGFDFNL